MPTFAIDTPDGASYEIDAPNEHAAVATLNQVHRPAPSAPEQSLSYFDPVQGQVSYTQGDVDRAKTSVVEPAVRGALQGLTLGAGDEIYAGLEGLRGQSYDRALSEARQTNAAAQAAHPWAYGGGQAVGGVAATLPMIAAAPGAFGMRAGQTIGSRTGAGALSGGALGGVQGFNEGEGGFLERAGNSLPSAATAMTIGGVAPVVGAAAGAGARALADRFGVTLPGIGRAASTEAVNAFEAAGPAAVRQRAAELGHDAMVLDLGQPFLGRAQGIAAMPGEAGERIVSGLQARNAGTNARLAGDVESAFGPAAPAADIEAQFAAKRAQAGPMYERATANAPPIDTTSALSIIGSRLNNAEGAERAGLQRALDLLMPARGQDGARIVQSDARNLHSAKRALDDLVTYGDPTIGVPRGAFSPADSAVFAVRRELNNALEAQAPGYAAANQMTATAHRASEALESGKRVLDTGESAIHPELFARDFSGRPIEQQAALRQGVRSDLDRIVGTKANDLQALRQQVMADGDWNRAKLAQVFGHDEADRVFRAVDREAAFRDAFNRVYQGSQTAQRTAGAAAMGVRDVAPGAGSPNLAIAGAAGGIPGVAAAGGLNLARRGLNALGRDADLARNVQTADILLQTGPARDATIQALDNALSRRSGGRQAATVTDRLVQLLLSTEGRQEPATDKAKMLGRALMMAR